MRNLFLMIGAVLVSGCAGPQIEIPKPTAVLAPPPPPPPVEESVVNIKVHVSVDELAAAADAAMPHSSGQEDTWREDGSLRDQKAVQYQYWVVRGPIKFSVVGDQLVSDFAEIQYRLALRLGSPEGPVLEGRCGYWDDPPKRLRLIARSRLSWTDDWTLRSDTAFDPPEFPDACRFANLNTDVTPIVQSILDARLPSVAAAIDAKVRERSKAKDRAHKVWSRLQQPLELGPNRWLVLNPTDVQVGPLGSDGRTIETSVKLILKPAIHNGSAPAAGDRPLPALRLAPTSLDGFHLTLPVMADYATINRRLQQRLVGQEFSTSIGEPVTITSAQLYGSGDKLIIELAVTGGMNGKLYVTGKPFYDRAARTLRFDQLDYTMHTENVVARFADSLFRETLLDRLESETRIDLSVQIDGLRKRLSSLLTREIEPGLWLEATVSDVNARGIYPVPGGVEVQIVADGFLQLSVR
jgi:hypothetical protein